VDDLIFKDGSSLAEAVKRLKRYIRDGDEEGAAREVSYLYDSCLSQQE